MPANIETNIYRCPKCHGKLFVKPTALLCSACASEYRQSENYYDFYIADHALPKTKYPHELDHLFFSAEKILALQEPKPNRFLNFIFRRHIFNTSWTNDLKNLKNTIKKYGADEKRRVEFMVDNRSSLNFIKQKKTTEIKAKSILQYVSSLPHAGNRVLHIGCGGECNQAIPIEYKKAGFVNFGVDAVRSYVKEFSAYGEAHLANASALPYADGLFDVVNFTDILEHLFDPLKGLQEAARVLKTHGFLVLETPNRVYLNRKNPVSWIEYFMGLLCPSLLRPRVITTAWAGEILFHTEFSKRELLMLFSHSGLRPIKVKTEILKKSQPEGMKNKLKRGIVFCLEKIAPTNKWLAIARKL
jgi:SAM-dependent methyltransferase